MQDRADIRAVHWQMARDASGAAILGGVALELDDLAQEIRQAILTPKGSVPLFPERGCDLDQFRDRPMNVRHMFIGAEVRDCLTRDVPRVHVENLTVEAGFSQVQLKLTWRPVEQVEAEFTETVIDLEL